MNCPYCSEHMIIKKTNTDGKVHTYWFDCDKGCRRKWEVKELGKVEQGKD